MSEGIKPFNPQSERPSEFMGNWVDKDVVISEEADAKKKAIKREAWESIRKENLQDDGTYSPRIMETSDWDWLTKHKIQYQAGYMGIGIIGKYDAANTDFEDLPFDFK